MPTPNSIDAYVLCGTPRSGSTLLCTLLDDTGIAGHPKSYFRRPDESSWAQRWQLPRDEAGFFDYGDYVRAAIAAGSTENGVFAARIMWGTLDEVVANLGSLHPDIAGQDLDLLTRAFGRLRFVYLRRDDTVAQAVSWARAEQTNYWQQDDVATSEVRPRFDFEQIHHLVQTIDEHNAAWREWFDRFGVLPQMVRYEDLTADVAGVTRSIVDALGLKLPRGHEITPRHSRQADDLNREWIARYHAECRA